MKTLDSEFLAMMHEASKMWADMAAAMEDGERAKLAKVVAEVDDAMKRGETAETIVEIVRDAYETEPEFGDPELD